VQKQRNAATVVFNSEICHSSLLCFRMKLLNRQHFSSSTSFVQSVFFIFQEQSFASSEELWL